MNAQSGRICFALVLLGLLLASLSIGSSARYDGMLLQAAVAPTMQLQGSAEPGEGSVAPDDDNGQGGTCARGDTHCAPPKKELTVALADERQSHEGKTFAAPGDELPPKHKD